MRLKMKIVFLIFASMLYTPSSFADNTTLPIQGYITDLETALPLEGEHELIFNLYENCDDETPYFTDVQGIVFESGVYETTLSLNETEIADLSSMDDLCLGIQIDDDTELEPRIEYNTTPYAIIANQAKFAQVAQTALSLDDDLLDSLQLDTASPQTWTGPQTYVSQMRMQQPPPSVDSEQASVLINPLNSIADAKYFAIQKGGFDRFTVDAEGDVVMTGGLRISSLTNCDTIDTDAAGNFSCGSDLTGGPPSGDITGDTITAQTGLALKDPTPGTKIVIFRAPLGLTADYLLTWPNDDGVFGQVLTTDGSGVLSWTTTASGDITGVTAGTGLTGGATSGDATLSVGVLTSANLPSNTSYLGSTIDLTSEVSSVLPSGNLPANLSYLGPSIDLTSEVTGTLTSGNLPAETSFLGSSINLASEVTGTLPSGNLPASTSLLGSLIESSEITDGTIATADLADNALTHIVSSFIANPQLTNDGFVQFKFPNNVTIQRVSCSAANASTVTIRLDERAETSPNSAGSIVMSSDLVCDSNSQITTSFSDNAIATNAILNMDIITRSGSTPALRIHVEYTINN